MAKQSYSIKGTNISNGDSVGNHIEQTVSVDDNILPAPQELAEYKSIDPKIVDFLIKSSEREQLHRHNQDEKKLKILSYNEHKVGRMNWWGMFFAFFLTSSSCHPKFFVKEFSYFLMPCHQHCLGINLLVQR